MQTSPVNVLTKVSAAPAALLYPASPQGKVAPEEPVAPEPRLEHKQDPLIIALDPTLVPLIAMEAEPPQFKAK